MVTEPSYMIHNFPKEKKGRGPPTVPSESMLDINQKQATCILKVKQSTFDHDTLSLNNLSTCLSSDQKVFK